MGNTVAIYNFKGGVGKTTTALNLGYAWSRQFKVLLIDCDPQCNLSNSLGADNSTKSIYRYIKDLLHDNLPENIEAQEVTPYMHLLPGDYLMTEMESNSRFISFGPNIVQKLGYVLRKDYDIVIMDMPTHFGGLVKSMLTDVDSILIPALADSFSIDGIKKLLTFLYTVERKRPLNILGIYFNMYKQSLIHHREKYTEAMTEFEDLMLESTVSNSIKVSEAIDIGKSMNRVNPENKSAIDFLKLSDELMAKFNNTFLSSKFISEEFLENIKTR
ncbi:ParA family protein [uncultured Imperialibacter sp.]|uniref:ParA family protein n=1 Tax=uncultured Imperialibacter sp. TaxID=1672639 RepID=UPI0030DBC5ED|tara:strand:+ start:3218 stop:4036 length:819 start_codon:yes stop_codon:yes gene_type:complete